MDKLKFKSETDRLIHYLELIAKCPECGGIEECKKHCHCDYNHFIEHEYMEIAREALYA